MTKRRTTVKGPVKGRGRRLVGGVYSLRIYVNDTAYVSDGESLFQSQSQETKVYTEKNFLVRIVMTYG